MRTIFVFDCRDGSGHQAYTIEKSGSNLPNDDTCRLGWRFFKEIQITEDPFSLIGPNPKEILQAIDRYGYYISLNQKKSN
jgi:hypothetical protein